MTNEIAVRRNLKVFFVAETTIGTLVPPTTNDALYAAGFPSINQTPSFTNSLEIQNTRDVMDRFQDRISPGNYTLPVYIRPSGTAGTAPMEDALLLALFGTKTIVGATSVTYSQAIKKPSGSLWIQYDHTVLFGRGVTVSQATSSAANNGAKMVEFSGQFMQLGVVGTQDLAAAITATDTTFEVDDASCYNVGGLVEFYDVSADTVDDNTSAGYTITAVNLTTNVITTSAIGSSFDIDDICRPWLPAATEVGSPIENRKTIVSINSVNKNVTKFDITLNDPCVYQENEITISDYVEAYVEDERNISGSIGVKWRRNDTAFFTDNVVGAEIPLSLVVGTVAGSIFTENYPKCSIDVPTTSDDSPTVILDMGFVALGNTTGEDSATWVFT